MSKSSKKKNTSNDNTIIKNRSASHEYHFIETFEAGMVLEGWEVKSMRAGRANLNDSYCIIKRGEVWLLGLSISPLITASTHIKPVPDRTRKLLLHRKEINKLLGAVKLKGQTVIPLRLYWAKNNRAKIAIALAKGKQDHDKRQSAKERDWQRQRERLLK